MVRVLVAPQRCRTAVRVEHGHRTVTLVPVQIRRRTKAATYVAECGLWVATNAGATTCRPATSYLVEWLAATLPFVMVLGLHRSRRVVALAGATGILPLFGITGFKSYVVGLA